MASIAVVTFLLTAAAVRGSATWSYNPSASDGPSHWKGLADTTCGGKRQSPVNIATTIADGGLKPIDPQWLPVTNASVRNDGHTIRVTMPTGPYIVPAPFTDPNTGIVYSLSHFHIHSPSEHTWGGSYRAMEIHFVHVAPDAKQWAVVSISFDTAAYGNTFLASFWPAVKEVRAKGATALVPGMIHMNELRPPARDYYTYPGSFTTPPCTEAVTWFVMQEPLGVTEKMLQAFRTSMGFTWVAPNEYGPMGNFRPTQPLGGRVVRRFVDGGAHTAAHGGTSKHTVLMAIAIVIALIAVAISIASFAVLGKKTGAPAAAGGDYTLQELDPRPQLD
jgi:carbonic anhydrase